MDVLARHAFDGDEVVLGLPPERQLSVVAELPARSTGAPVDLLAREELARQARVSAEGVRSACWALPGGAGARQRSETESVMVLGCLTDDAENLLVPMIEAGARVLALDTRSGALARCAGEMLGAGDGLWALLHVDPDATILVMMLGGVVVYERALPEGSVRALVERAKAKMRLDAAGAACRYTETIAGRWR